MPKGSTLRTPKYQVIETGDLLNLTIYDVTDAGKPKTHNVEFRTQGDYRRFIRDLKQAGQDSDGDGVVDSLLEKLRVEWEATIPVGELYRGLEGHKEGQ